MNALANASVSRHTAARGVRGRVGALTADRVAIAVVGLVSVSLMLLTWNRWGDLWLDSGYDLVAGAKISHASAPYLDFDYWYGPLGPLLVGAVYEIFGIGIAPAVGLGLVIAFAAIGLGFAVARRLVGPAAAAIVGCLAAVPAFSNSNVSFVQPHTYGATIGIVLCLSAILVVARFSETDRRRWLVALGVLVGLAATTRHECFGALALAVGIWLLVRVARAHGARRPAVAELAIVVGTSIAVALLGYGSFLVAAQFHGSLTLSQLIHDNLFPTGLMRNSIATVFKTLAPRTPESFVKLAGMVVLYAGGAGALLVAARGIDAGGRRRQAVVMLLGLVAIAGLAVLLAKPDTVRFYLKYAFAWLPAGAVLASGLLIRRAVRNRAAAAWSAQDQIALLVAVMLVGFSYSVYAAYWPYPNPDYPQETAYAMAIVATFLAWFHLRELPAMGVAKAATVRALGLGWLGALAAICIVLLIGDARSETFTVRGVDGSMTATAADGPMLQRAVDLIESNTERSEPILLAPQMTSLYVMTGRHDQLRQLSLLPGALDGPGDERRAIADLEAAGVRFAIIDTTPLTRYETGPFGVGYDRQIGAWLHKNFMHITTLRGRTTGSEDAPSRTLDVWLRRTL
ncbi:MAG: glycosyltransferase family 39 protein [Baekduia sp.]